MEDLNTPEYLAKIQRAIYENLREKEAAPGIQMQSESRRNRTRGSGFADWFHPTK